MLQTETQKSRIEQCNTYVNKYLENRELEWLIEHGKIRESIYFKGETGDRYTIYVATRRNANIIDFHTIFNMYGHGTEHGTHIGTLRGYVLTIKKESNSWSSSQYGLGYTFKQLMRQGVMSKKNPWKIRYCRSAHFVKLNDKTEFTPWSGMQINIKDGVLVNKPNRVSKNAYNTAKNQDSTQNKRNRLANKNNREALERYRKAGGDTNAARDGWVRNGSQNNWQRAEPGAGTEKINWDMIPMDDIFKHRNATLRSNILQHYGINALLETLSYDTVDIDFVDKREYKLLNVTIPDNSLGTNTENKCLYLQMINPSTGESHFEGIANVGVWNAPKEATVKEALAWRDGDRDIQGLDGWRDNDKKTEYVVPVKLT
jgi:hypothetical protein